MPSGRYDALNDGESSSDNDDDNITNKNIGTNEKIESSIPNFEDLSLCPRHKNQDNDEV